MLLLLTLLALTAGDPAAVAPSPVQPAAEAAKSDDKPVCVTKAKVGTRFKERVCMDKAEYARRQEEERKALDRMQRVPVNCKQTGGC